MVTGMTALRVWVDGTSCNMDLRTHGYVNGPVHADFDGVRLYGTLVYVSDGRYRVHLNAGSEDLAMITERMTTAPSWKMGTRNPWEIELTMPNGTVYVFRFPARGMQA